MTELTIKELCQKYGISQADLSHRFGIPYRTVQDWHSGRRKTPEYVVRMISSLLDKDERHGCWMYGETNNPFVVEVYCPWCGKPALYPDEEDDNTRPLETDFCPHCGTVMDAANADPSWPFYSMSLKQKLKNKKLKNNKE